MEYTDQVKLERKESQRVNASVLLRRGNKIIMGVREREEPGRDQVWVEMGEEVQRVRKLKRGM